MLGGNPGFKVPIGTSSRPGGSRGWAGRFIDPHAPDDQTAGHGRTDFWSVDDQAMASIPFFSMTVRRRSAGPPGRLMPRSQSETRFLLTLR